MAHAGNAGRYRRAYAGNRASKAEGTAAASAGIASSETARPLIDTLAALVLSIAAVATAWSAYQSSRWNGVMATDFNRAGATRTESLRADNAAGQATIVDVTLAADWGTAQLSGNQDLADALRARMSPELAAAMTLWLDGWEPGQPLPEGGPFSDGRYTPPGRQKALDLEDQASTTFAAGTTANQRSDNYVLTGVLFALSLFFAGISSRVRDERYMKMLVFAATGIAVVGLFLLALQPKSFSI